MPRVLGRLNSEEYVGSVEELDRLELEPFRSFRDARAAVLQAQGLEKVKLWVQNRIQEPRFDDPDAKMPRTSLSEEEAARIATHLVGVQPSKTPAKSKRLFRKINPVGDIADFFEDRLPIATRYNAKNFLAAFFGLGLFAGIGGTAVAFLFLSPNPPKDRDGRREDSGRG